MLGLRTTLPTCDVHDTIGRPCLPKFWFPRNAKGQLNEYFTFKNIFSKRQRCTTEYTVANTAVESMEIGEGACTNNLFFRFQV